MYLVDVILGGSRQPFRLLVDTGSSVLVVAGKNCRSQNRTSRQLFDASNSTLTAKTMFIKYGFGSLKGHVVKDEVCLRASGTGAKGAESLTEVTLLQAKVQRQGLHGRLYGAKRKAAEPCARMSFLVASEESDDFAKLPFDGILGLGLQDSELGANDFSFLRRLNALGYTEKAAFTLLLGNTGDSQIVLSGADNRSFLGGRTLWVPLSKASGSNWQFSVADFTLDGKAQRFGSIEVMLDSGTSLLAADEGIRKWLLQKLSPDSCAGVDHLPVLGLRLPDGHAALPLFPSDYVDQSGGIEGLPECKLAIMPEHFQAVNGQRLVLGDSFLRRFATTFDLPNRRIGFGIVANDELGHAMFPVMFPEARALSSSMDRPLASSNVERQQRFRRGSGRLRQSVARPHPANSEFDRIANAFMR
jgi:hypothetical protein